MSRRYTPTTPYRWARRAVGVNASADLVATGYAPPPPAGPDRPDLWHGRPMHLAPFRCHGCDTPFHVRRHLENHPCERTT